MGTGMDWRELEPTAMLTPLVPSSPSTTKLESSDTQNNERGKMELSPSAHNPSLPQALPLALAPTPTWTSTARSPRCWLLFSLLLSNLSVMLSTEEDKKNYLPENLKKLGLDCWELAKILGRKLDEDLKDYVQG